MCINRRGGYPPSQRVSLRERKEIYLAICKGKLDGLREIGAKHTIDYMLDDVLCQRLEYVMSPRWFFDFLFGERLSERVLMGTALLTMGLLPAQYVAWGDPRLAACTAVSTTVVILFTVSGGLYRWRKEKSRWIQIVGADE